MSYNQPAPRVWCPYPDCDYGGDEDEVDAHRVAAHRDEAQAGSNLSERPRHSRFYGR